MAKFIVKFFCKETGVLSLKLSTKMVAAWYWHLVRLTVDDGHWGPADLKVQRHYYWSWSNHVSSNKCYKPLEALGDRHGMLKPHSVAIPGKNGFVASSA
jgi:hypothetical protein